MKVFISWSGERSMELAKLLRGWLPDVIQRCQPWFSEEDIHPGMRWSLEIEKNLAEASFGIICLTPERLNAPWLVFEAGALATRMGQNRLVCPLLLGLEKRKLQGPLAQFQAKVAHHKNEMFELIKAINGSDQDALDETVLKRNFDAHWEKYEEKVLPIMDMDIPAEPSAEPKALPSVSFDCTKEEFINRLSDCNEVTILGITNSSLPGCLDKAWEKRRQARKRPWDKVEIIFPAQHLLKDMPFPGINDGQQSLDHLYQKWEFGVERARQFLRSYTNPDNPGGKRAVYVEIRSYDKPFPFVGQVYDNSLIRVAYILPDKDIRSSCYINLQKGNPPCKSLKDQVTEYLEGNDVPPCKKRSEKPVNCESCGWEQEHSPCYAIYNAFRKISNASTPLLAANIIGWVKNREDPDNLSFGFSSLRPQNNWRESLRSAAAGKPVHLLAFVILRIGKEVCLLLRNEKNSSGEFGRYGVLPGKVNDVDFFAELPKEAYRGKVYDMQRAWDTRDTDKNSTVFLAEAMEASDMFARLLNIKKGVPVSDKLLNAACSRAAVRSIYERIGLLIEPGRLHPQRKTFLVPQGDYELFIRCFVLDLEQTELDLIDNPDLYRKSAEELKCLKKEAKLTDFLMEYTDDILTMLGPTGSKKKSSRSMN